MTCARGQSNVIGVALLMGIAIIAMAGLTAGIGSVVESNAASADTNRVASEMAVAFEPVETTGHNRGTLSFTAGQLRTVDRELRILNASGVRHSVDVGGLVFEASDRRVAYVSDSIVRESGSSTWVTEPPQLTASETGRVLIVSAARVNASDVAVSSEGTTTVTLQTTVTHERIALGNDTYRVAIETETPAALTRWFESKNATVTERDVDGDGVPSVVARFHGQRVGYLVVHDMQLEVAGK